VDLLHQFFGLHFPRGRSPGVYEIGVVIATLPDPADSHSDWAYDTDLEAIRRAFETAGFVVDRFWVPGPGDSVDVMDGKAALKLARREWEPGVLLFRDRRPDGQRLRILLTAPETPTGGIYRDAFHAALNAREAVLTHADLPLAPVDRHLIRIVGPTFSGSALSLRLMLRGAMALDDTAEIITGTATSPDNQKTLHSLVPRIRFRAAINSDASLAAALDSLVLRRLQIPGSRVAVLRESSTQYGGSVLSGRPRMRAGGTASDRFLSVTFPMSIASLRTAYAQTPASGETPAAGPAIPTSKPKLGLDLLDQPRPKEDLPAWSRLTPPTVDLLFDEVAAVLNRERIRLVGLLATDVRDKLFLASELRRRVRDVQFFTFESNVLYLRSDWRSSLAGMLVLSTYPLTVWAEPRFEPGSPQRSRPAFANDGAQGSYNATLLQLGVRGRLLDYGSSDSLIRRPQVWLSAVGRGAFLPLATMVDQSPAALAYVAADSGAVRAQKPIDPPKPTVDLRLAQVLVVVLSALALMVLAFYSLWGDYRIAKALRCKRVGKAPANLLDLREHVRNGSLEAHERLYSLLRLLAVGGIWLAAVSTLGWSLRESGSRWLLLPEGIALVAGVSMVLAFLSAMRLLWRLRGAGRSYIGRLNTHLLAAEDNALLWFFEITGRVVVVLFGLTFFWYSFWFAMDPGQFAHSQLFYLRAANLESEVTPLLPLLASGAAFTAWCCWHLTRIRLLRRDTAFGAACARELQPVPEAEHAREDFVRRLREAAAAARGCRNSLFLVFPHLAAFGVLVMTIAICLRLMPEFGRTLESINFSTPPKGRTNFDWLLQLSVLAGFVTTVWAVVRLLAVWRKLKVCLDELISLPLVDAFARLPAGIRRLARLSLPGRNIVASVGASSIRQWQQLKELYAAHKAQIVKEAPGSPQGLQDRLDELMAGPEVYPRELDTERPPRALVDKIGAMHLVLAELWSLERLEPPAPAGATAPNLTLFREKLEEYLATQVVGFAEWVVAHLRVLALFLLLSLVLTTLMLYSYPFQPQGLVRILFGLILLISVISVVYVSIQMNRHELLSLMAGTGAGAVTWDARLVTNLLTFGAIPLLTLLGSSIPALRSILSSWFQPLLQTVVKP
jgi:hypothetical protein